jgi:hypothetical protein
MFHGASDETNFYQQAPGPRAPLPQLWRGEVPGDLHSSRGKQARSPPPVPELQGPGHHLGTDDRRLTMVLVCRSTLQYNRDSLLNGNIN